MRVASVLVLAIAITASASAAAIDAADAWRPMHSFIGTWKGTRTGTDGLVRVTRVYASASTNHHLEITEKGGGSRPAVWGIVSFDPQQQALVLRQFAADGSALDFVLDPSTSTAGPLVFSSSASEAARTRITYERAGARNLVERIEHSTDGESFTVVSETRFVRMD